MGVRAKSPVREFVKTTGEFDQFFCGSLLGSWSVLCVIRIFSQCLYVHVYKCKMNPCCQNSFLLSEIDLHLSRDM